MAATSSSPHEVGTLRNLASCYLVLNLEVAPSEIQIMVEFLCHHDLNIPLTRQAQVPISLIQRAYHTARYLRKEDCVQFDVDAKKSMQLDKSKFLVAIGFPNLPKEERNIKEPTNDELFDMLEKMNYLGGRLEKISDFTKAKLPVVWHYLSHILLRCLSGKSGGTLNLNRGYLCILYGLYYDKDVDIGDILWNDFITYIGPKKAEIPSGRFWGLILKLCYKELKLEMPKGELAVFRTIKKFIVPDQSCFGVVNPIPEEMLKYIPTTSTVLSSYLKAMDHSKSSQATPSGKGNTKRQYLGTTTVTGTLKRKHEPSRNSPVKRSTKKSTSPTPSRQGDVRGEMGVEKDTETQQELAQKAILDARRSICDAELAEFDRHQMQRGLREEAEKTTLLERGRKATEESLKLIEEDRQKKLEQEEIERKAFEESEKRKNEKYLEKKREIGEKKKADKGQGGTEEDVLEVNFAEGEKLVAFEDDSSPSSFTLFTKTNNEDKICLDDSSAESAKKIKEIKASQGISEGLSKTRKQGSKYVSKKKFKQMEKTLNDVLEFVKHIPTAADVYTSRADFTKLLDTLGKTHGEEINRFSTQILELRKQNIVLHSVVVKLLKSLEILAKPPLQPSCSLEVLSILKSMQTTVEDLPKRLSYEPLKKHFDEAFAKLFALMTDLNVFGQENGGEEGSSRRPTPLTIFGEDGGGENEEIVVEKVQKRPSPPPKQIEDPEVTPDAEKPEGGRRTSLRLNRTRLKL